MLIFNQIGDGDGEFEGLKGGARMMSLLTLFGGLKNVFKVSINTDQDTIAQSNIVGEDILNRYSGIQTTL